MKKTISLIVLLAMIVTLFSGCHRPGEESSTAKLSLADQARIAANNMQNSSHFATDGKYLYCSDWDDGLDSFSEILKVRMDDFTIENRYETMMSYGEEFTAYNVICINNILYYYNWSLDVLFSLNTQNGENMELPFSDPYTYVQTDGEYIYVSDWMFFDEPGIYKASIADISQDSKNDKTIFTKISDLYVTRLIMQGEYLYFYSSEFNLNGKDISENGLWRADLDGNNPIKIMKNRPRYFLVTEDKIFFVAEEDCIYSMNLDGSDRNVLGEAYIDADLSVTSINTAGGYIFYRYAEDGTLHRVNTDGTNDIQLNNCETTDIVIAGDWVIYLNEDDWNYYKMHFDGTHHSLISEVPTEEEPTKETEISETHKMPIETEPVVNSIGDYSVDDIKSGGYGFFIMYDDGSFDRYYSGNVLTWEGPRPMTYGADYIPENMIISISKDRANREKINSGKLVLVCSETNRIEYSLTPVEFGGNALSTTVEGKTVAMFLTKSSVDYWSSGKNIGWFGSGMYTIKVNNTPLSDWCANLEAENSRGYFPLREGQEMEISIAYGATMESFDCVVDLCYYFQNRDTELDLKFEPTSEGYAIIDFTDVPAGEYLIHYSYWNEESRARSVLATHVVVE